MAGPNKPESSEPCGRPSEVDPTAGAAPSLAGLLVVDKPLRMSSARAVAIVKRRAGRAKTGHAGTLDPLATGVLVLGIGRATRLLGQFMDAEKRYRTTVDLTAFTTTDDLEGERTEVAIDTPPTPAEVAAALGRFVGRIMQRPPAHSAIKIGGRRSYALARAGKAVEPEPREVTIHHVELLRYDWPRIEIDVRCAKGVYIRSLARDIGVVLKTGGHCVELRRTGVGPFLEAEATAPDDLPAELRQSDLIDPDVALARLGAGSDGSTP